MTTQYREYNTGYVKGETRQIGETIYAYDHRGNVLGYYLPSANLTYTNTGYIRANYNDLVSLINESWDEYKRTGR